MSNLGKAIKIASVEFENKLDKGGRPYILHCLWVMDRVRHLGDEYMIVAVLHDLIEDTKWTFEKLRKEGFSEKVIDALKYLTHLEKDSYEDYIEMISCNEIARAVKLRDLEHNSKITRLKGVTKRDFERMKKYNNAYLFLSKI